MAKNTEDELTDERLRTWMLNVMRRKGWTAEKWAKKAGVSGTTVTRFINGTRPGMSVTVTTVARLARTADTAVTIGGGEEPRWHAEDREIVRRTCELLRLLEGRA